jgi:hypothetical protein
MVPRESLDEMNRVGKYVKLHGNLLTGKTVVGRSQFIPEGDDFSREERV